MTAPAQPRARGGRRTRKRDAAPEQKQRPSRVSATRAGPAGRRDPGHVIGDRYRLIEPLGRGGMGRVYRAHDELLDREIALKLLFEDATAERELQRACATEARVACRLTHPGVARVLDSGVDHGRCFVVSELIRGRTLSSILREEGPLALGPALDLAIELANALAAVHALGIVHCDVKPSNIIVADDGHARLVDFGIARSATMTTGLTDEALRGSADYVAPEQVQGGRLDGRVDLYALGVVLYEMVAGQTPFGGGTLVSVVARRLVVEPPALSARAAGVPPRLNLVMRKALARRPDDRYQTATELRNGLLGVKRALAASESAPVTVVRPTRVGVTPAGSIVQAARELAGRSGAALGRALGRVALALNGPWRSALAEHGAYARSPRVWAAGTVPVLALLVASSFALGVSETTSPPEAQAAPATGPALVAAVTSVPTAIAASATALPPTARPIEPTTAPAESAAVEPPPAAAPTAVSLASAQPPAAPPTDVPPISEPTTPSDTDEAPTSASTASAPVPAPTPRLQRATTLPMDQPPPSVSQLSVPARQPEPSAPAPTPPIHASSVPPASNGGPSRSQPPTRQPVTAPPPKPPPAPKPSQRAIEPVRPASQGNNAGKQQASETVQPKGNAKGNGSNGNGKSR